MWRLRAAINFKLTSPRGTMPQSTNQRLTGPAGRPGTILPSNASFEHAELNETLQVIKQQICKQQDDRPQHHAAGRPGAP